MVEQTTGSANSEIVYGPGGDKLALMNDTSLIKAFVPLTGGATAVYTSSGLAYYRHTDHLGSSRLSSTPTNTVYSDTAYSAFGEPYAQSGAIDPSFTGQNQDTTAGLYDFLFREQDPNQGRWASPDPLGLAAVDLSNPQSWNRYVYVLNSPLNFIDPLGLLECNVAGQIIELESGQCPDFPTVPMPPPPPGCYWGTLFGDMGGGGAIELICTTPIQIDVWAPYLSGCGGGNSSGNTFLSPPIGTTFIGPETDWFRGKQAGCMWPGIKGFIGAIVMKKEIDAVGNFLMGDSSAVPGMITPGSVSIPAHLGLDAIAGSPNNRPVIATIREALSEEGWKVSGNALARGAKFFAKAALVIHAGFALSDGRGDYKACMEN